MSPSMSRGSCLTCGKELSKNQMTRHVAACAKSGTGGQTCFHLIVEGRYDKAYWLHVAAGPTSTLADLDAFLRDIWLECCGHLSAFEIAGEQYLSNPAWSRDKGMGARLNKVLYPGISFTHRYDFGTSTELNLRLMGALECVPGKKKVRAVARNLPHRFECVECGRPATQLCSDCSWEAEAWFCDDCAQGHECGEEMLLPVVNSPRMGQCGYTGNAF